MQSCQTETLRKAIEELKQALSTNASFAKILGIAAQHPCPRRCIEELTAYSGNKVDEFYYERHEYIRRLLVDALLVALENSGFNVNIKAENRTTFGTGDVDIEVLSSVIEVRCRDIKVRIEIKGGSAFDIGQIVRYLMDVDAVVLCLAGRGTAFSITRKQATQLLDFVTDVYKRKLGSLDKWKDVLVQGPWCLGCPVDCQYSKSGHSHEVDFQREFVESIPKWGSAISRAVELCVQLLQERKGEQVDGA